ncbi:MAG: transglutaminase-like domain-containing protein [Candidatus Marinimicrobia bacterium]|jgi:transglutaminase-like putative cysteine protease|nr:transglutaminase-like domain-containing protein [Candidatus Neomarinimicrobiota bacterium]MDP6593753.1 transglutaminase-like domain-containing protein [Candidatus Neomarinimicrobiota bacterium]MDP6837058.1 transglutaminase-like domain-containing protein [Candidatus Neomarinimicrobiota bacterium]|tara:strand:+ start:102 stop:800 length:699 start_codon:yes stop_codon:yes gene_type:complete
MSQVGEKYLNSTAIIDSDHASIAEYAARVIEGSENDPVAMAVKLYLAVRDGIWYDPYSPFYLPEHYRASSVLKCGRGFCISKASLLSALGRACGIPTRIGFATVRNHLATRQFIEMLGSNIFVYHAYVDLFLDGKWVKATPAFNVELCHKHKVTPLEFNGREDSLFHAYNLDRKQFMEYTEFHGTHADIPVDEIVSAWEESYGKRRISKWIQRLESSGGKQGPDFFKEEVVK